MAEFLQITRGASGKVVTFSGKNVLSLRGVVVSGVISAVIFSASAGGVLDVLGFLLNKFVFSCGHPMPERKKE